MKARNFVKHIVKAKNFNNNFNSTRQQKVKQLSRQHEVSWELTQELLAVSSADGSTSFAQSNKKSFQVKCFTEELSTLVKLQRQRPDLYSSDWRCATCGNDTETYEHVWLANHVVKKFHRVFRLYRTNYEQVVRLNTAPTWS